MKVRHLSAPIGPALVQATAELAAAPAGTAEEWQLPDGEHAIPAALTLSFPGRAVRLHGSDACSLKFATGGLSLRADAVEIRELAIDTADGEAALRVDAPRIVITDIDAAASGSGAVAAVDLTAEMGSIDVDDLTVSRVKGEEAIGLRALGGSVRVMGAAVSNVEGASATGVRIGAIADAAAVALDITEIHAMSVAVGAIVAAGGRVEVARVEASVLTGDDVVGIAVLGFGHSAGRVSVVDLGAAGLTASARASGLLVAAPRPLAVRGFTVADVTGEAAAGVVVAGGVSGGAAGEADVEVAFGRVGRVVAKAGDAAGLRVVAMPSPRPVIVRDVAVTGVAGSPVPPGPIPPHGKDGEPAWHTWARDLLTDLANEVQPRAVPPAVLAAADVVGLFVTATVDDIQPFLDERDAGDLAIIDSSVRVVSGSAIQIETGLRPAWLRRIEASTALRAGFLQADQVIVANTTWDRLGAALEIGPGEVRVYDSLFSRVTSTGEPIALDPDADWIEGKAVFAETATQRFAAFGALPYVAPGAADIPAPLLAGDLPPPEEINLHLVAGSTLHQSAVATPPDDLELSDDNRLFVGAYPSDVPALCDLYDPLRRPTGAAVRPQPPSPVVNYRARDARALLAVMLDRAQQVMPTWTDRGPADFTTMLLETVAERLDHLAYQQERAVAEGFLEDARLRRSVEDHVRPLDYEIDPGLSATAMLRFRLDLSSIAAVIAARQREAALTDDADREAQLTSTIAALTALAEDGALEIPAGTLAANRRDDDQVIVFATEEPLAYFPDLDAVALVDDVPGFATSARLAGALPGLVIGRWLLLWRGPGRGGHVVRVTSIVRGTDVVEIGWDPRRPLPWPLPARPDPASGVEAASVLGNVIPAHHGIPLSTLSSDAGSPDLQRYGDLLEMVVNGGPGAEIPLPFGPISVQASGHPLPGDERRRGKPAVRVMVDDDEWTRVDNLACARPGDEVFALRTSADGRATLRFGDGVSGTALPGHGNRLRFHLAIGLGRAGNVGEGVLSRLLHVPVDASRGPITGWLFQEDMETIRGLLAVDNPIGAIGGRDPEPIDRMRYRAPLLAARPLSAVTPEDYERAARALPEVAAAHARIVAGAVQPVMLVTVLLRDEDTLDPDERLRRWAVVRASLEGARLLGFDVESVPPMWAPLDLDVVVDAHPHAEAGAVRDAVIAAVSGNGGLLDPDTTGLGGDVHLADIYRALLSAYGVAAARVRRFRRLRQGAPDCLPMGVIPIKPDEVPVVRGPARPASDGILTVTVCGGLR